MADAVKRFHDNIELGLENWSMLERGNTRGELDVQEATCTASSLNVLA
jgi:hypothetical protein